jgi:hypothetical protein
MNDKESKDYKMKTAKTLINELPTMKNNTDLNDSDFNRAVDYRLECVGEFLTYLETGKTDHIFLEDNANPQHFK